MPRTRRSFAPRRALALLTASAIIAAGIVTLSAAPASAAVPPTRAGLTAAIEPLQPYVGQSICDPVAKAGVVAFRDLLLRTYPNTGSLGIVRDCGIGGVSEHKEGRAFDWATSASNPVQDAQVQALITWLTKTDQYGNKASNARRLGLMYMIYNRKIWKTYDDRGWRDYTGVSPHTDHVHFSFSWAGSRKTTSYWDGTVAPIDFGPRPPARVTPVLTASNLAVVRQYGNTWLKIPTTSNAVTVLQRGLHVAADGNYGTDTATPLTKFQVDQGLTPTGVVGPTEWLKLFPRPIAPFGALGVTDSGPAGTRVTGWAIDADTSASLTADVVVDGLVAKRFLADVSRPDVETAYPGFGNLHGADVTVPLTEGTHQVCLRALNYTGTPGVNTTVGCRSVTIAHNAVGAVEVAAQRLRVVRLSGWTVDPDSSTRPGINLTVDGVVRSATWTAVTRPDISSRYPGVDPASGFTTDLTLAAGSHQVCSTFLNAAGTPGTDSAPICRTVIVRHDPVGLLELAGQRPTGVVAQGWALDPDTITAVPVTLTVDGVSAGTAPTDKSRPDVIANYPTHDALRGFVRTLALSDGAHRVCAIARDDGTPGGKDLPLGCKNLTVRHAPVGSLQRARTEPGKGIALLGWGLDPDTTASIPATVTLDGALVRTVTASARRDDVARAYPGYGSAHGFVLALPASPGRHTVCVSLSNAANTLGAATPLGCRTLMVATPSGAFERVSVSGRTVTVQGWALDPDVSRALAVKVIVDGRVLTTPLANRTRNDIAAAWPGYGPLHGFVASVAVARGSHTVCVHALNVVGTPGANRTLGCKSVSVA